MVPEMWRGSRAPPVHELASISTRFALSGQHVCMLQVQPLHLSLLRSGEEQALVPPNKSMGDIEELAASYERKLIEAYIPAAHRFVQPEWLNGVMRKTWARRDVTGLKIFPKGFCLRKIVKQAAELGSGHGTNPDTLDGIIDLKEEVAEMHGELIEFNERLYRSLMAKDHLIVQMRQELIDLRGPVPGDLSQTSDDPSLSDFETAHRALINVWIPSVFLQGRAANAYHVYQVYIRIQDNEWNVYRRYTEFRELHNHLRTQFPQIDAFAFPPKKALGNKILEQLCGFPERSSLVVLRLFRSSSSVFAEARRFSVGPNLIGMSQKQDAKFVEERRKQLQGYLRMVMNKLIQTLPEFTARPTKETLLSLLPFCLCSHAPLLLTQDSPPSLRLLNQRAADWAATATKKPDRNLRAATSNPCSPPTTAVFLAVSAPCSFWTAARGSGLLEDLRSLKKDERQLMGGRGTRSEAAFKRDVIVSEGFTEAGIKGATRRTVNNVYSS
ncbi:unnamed protein product [Tetraodon nigroviridis]|uniref:(spotted green pufferfish) hypothetical protein n=1 Tax=Tetraodon nigroviridis TaxID=99883 RepID=Q4S4E1_TETNG|nr:unnamed protein product [Tetraodon nigroviridis]